MIRSFVDEFASGLGMVGLLILLFLVAMVLIATLGGWGILLILAALIPAAVAHGKGRSFVAWWLYGTLLFIVALPHALLARPSLDAIDRRQEADGFRKSLLRGDD